MVSNLINTERYTTDNSNRLYHSILPFFNFYWEPVLSVICILLRREMDKPFNRSQGGMKMTQRNRMLFLVIAVITLAFIIAGPASAKVIKWKMATSWPAGIPLYTDGAEAFAKRVASMSDGRLKIRVTAAGTLCGPLETTESVAKGVVDLCHSWPGYDIGRDPTACLFGGYAGGMESVAMMHWLYYGGGAKMWSEWAMETFGVVAFPMGNRPPEAFAHSHVPIRSLADLKGIKFRTVGAWAQILPGLGASVVSMAGNEVFPALERKVLDATEWATPGENIISGMHEVAKYVIVPGVHQPSAPFNLYINKDKWAGLPKDLQAIVETAAQDVTFTMWMKIGRLDMDAMEVFKKQGNEVIFLDSETQKKGHELGQEWAKKHAEKNAWFKKVFESQVAFEKQWNAVGKIRYFDR